MTVAFHEVLFPTRIALGSHGGPERRTDIVVLGSGAEERNNRWALYSSLARGIDKVRLIAVWDGKNELSHDLDARLVKHMIDLMRDTGGIVEHINPFKLSMDSVMTDVPDLPLLETDTPSQSTKPAPVKLSPSSKPKSNKKK